MVFYEGSVHIPLIMRLPGVIPAGTGVREPVSNMALFATVTDYLDVPAPAAPSTSESLRPLIEGTTTTARVVFSFWNSDISPGYMAFDGRFKLMICRKKKIRKREAKIRMFRLYASTREASKYGDHARR